MRLRRNNVAIDVINFANPDNVPKLTALVEAADNSKNSHFLDVPLGIASISQLLFSSSILFEGAEEGGAGVGAGDFGAFGGETEPNILAALKLSMEE